MVIKVWERIFWCSHLPSEGSQLWEHRCPGKRFSGSQKASKGTLSRHWPHWFHNFTGGHKLRISRDWLRPIETPRCRGRVGVAELEREIVWEDERAWKNARNVVKMTNTNFKHTTPTANTMPSIPIILLFYCLEIVLSIFVACWVLVKKLRPGHYQI